jgi:hypothetical protein
MVASCFAAVGLHYWSTFPKNSSINNEFKRLHFVGFPYLARPVFEYIVTQNAEACLIHCTPEIVPNKDAREIIKEVCIAGIM